MAEEIHWPEEIISLLLSKLPAKHVLRFKRLSRYWLEVIMGGPLFHSQMLRRLTANPTQCPPALLLVDDLDDYLMEDFEDTVSLVPTSRGNTEPPLSIPLLTVELGLPNLVGISNGLLCFANWVGDNVCTGLLIWNPMRGEFLAIESPDLPIGFGVGNEKQITTFGFGFCERTKDFKLFHICANLNSQTEVMVRYVRPHELWTESNTGSTPNHIRISDKSSVTAHNRLNWICQQNDHFFNLEMNSILCLSISDEDFVVVNLPVDISHSSHVNLRIGEIRGSICVFVRDGYMVEIWVIQNHSFETWTKQYTFQPPVLNYGTWFSFIKALVVDNEDTTVLKHWQHLVHYHPRYGTEWRRQIPINFEDAHPFAGSLVSPTILGGIGPVEDE